MELFKNLTNQLYFNKIKKKIKESNQTHTFDTALPQLRLIETDRSEPSGTFKYLDGPATW